MNRKECIIVSADDFYPLLEEAYGDNKIWDDIAINPMDGILTSGPVTLESLAQTLSEYLNVEIETIVSDHADDQQIYLILKEN